MKTYMKWSLGSILMVAAMGLTGCGQGFKVVGSGSGIGSNATESLNNVKLQIAEAEQATDEAESAMAEAHAAIASISDANGNINVDIFSASSPQTVTPQGVLTPVTDKLKSVFDTVISKVQLVKSKIDTARAALASAMLKLDSSDPVQAALIAQINEGLAKLDDFEGQFRNAMQMLAGKLDVATAAIDGLIAKGCALIPIPGLCAIAGVILDMVLMDDVKALIAHFKSQLLSL